MSLQTIIAVAALGAAGTVGAGLGGWFTGKHAGWQARDDQAVSDQAKADRDHLAAQLEKSRRMAIADHGAQNEAAKSIARARGARDGAQLEREQLREQVTAYEAERLAASDADPACGADAAAAASRELLVACASSYQAVAGEAGDLAAKLDGLQRWVAGVCTGP